MRTQSRTRSGFTLVELLVVIAIIGLLASIDLTVLNNTRRQDRDARREADMRLLQEALDLYAHDHGGTYPNSAAEASVSEALKVLVPGYITLLPDDPLPRGQHYLYKTSAASSSSKYCMGAQLESVVPMPASTCGALVTLSQAVNYSVGKR